MTPKTGRIGSWIVLVMLVLFLVLAIAFVAVGWGSADVATAQSMSTGAMSPWRSASLRRWRSASGSCRSSSTATAKVTTRSWERQRMKNGGACVRSTRTPIGPAMLPSDKRVQYLP